MKNSTKIDPYGFREYDARWLYEKNVNLLGIENLGKGLGTQIINHTKKKNPIRIILDSNGTIRARSRILRTSSRIPTIIVVTQKAHKKNLSLLEDYVILGKIRLPCQ